MPEESERTGPPARYHVSDRVRYAHAEGCVIVLDLQTESYFVLDPVASTMWGLLVRHGERDPALRALEQQYGVDPTRLAGDFSTLVERWVKDGFMTCGWEEPTPPLTPRTHKVFSSRPWLLTLRAWWNLFCASRRLARKKFSQTYGYYSRLPLPAAEPEHVKILLPRALAAFARAENFFYLKGAPDDCVPRSFALFGFLRSLGIAVEHCIGVQRSPFKAHAWVEYDSHVVYEDPAGPLDFVPITRIACSVAATE